MCVFTKLWVPCLFLLAIGCREKYVPHLNEVVTGYLVVEGYINSGTGPTTIRLTRSTKVGDTASIVKETKALVRVEGKTSGTSVVLTETGTNTGIYSVAQLSLNANDQYRLFITTAAGKTYASDYSKVRKTVDIDSVAWRLENGGVQIYANAHDAQNATIYYLYRFDETWEFHSTYPSATKIYKDSRGQSHHVGYRDSAHIGAIDSTLYNCWQNLSSSKIVINSTEQLTKDVVSMFPVQFIERGSIKLSVLYTINLKQYAMSQEAFRFYEAMRKNTEQIGSIFDAQPSDNLGNIHSLTNESERAVGFVEVTQEITKRIFISNSQLPNWINRQECQDLVSVPNIPDSVKQYENWIPTLQDPAESVKNLSRVMFGEPVCVDCALRGVNTKPAFWPY